MDDVKKPASEEVFTGILGGIFVIIVILIIASHNVVEMVPTAIVCPSFMGNGASWEITQADGGYYVAGSFYSDEKTILAGYRSRAGKDCKFIY